MPHTVRSLALVALLACLTGCFGKDDRPVQIVAIGDPQSLFSADARMPHAARLLRAATVEGLVAFDEKGNVVPALADRWIVTDDGLSYIFRLRDGKWGDRSPITAESAQASLQQAIAAQRGQPLGSNIAVIDEIKAMAGRVIEIRLHQPMPDFLQLLAQPELGLVHNRRGAGPMTSKRTSDKEIKLSGVLLRPIAPEDRGLPAEEGWQEHTRRLRFSASSAQTALKLFAAGDIDLVLGGTFADYPRIDSAGISFGSVRFDPVQGLFGLSVVHGDGLLSLPENREAIAMAIDREALSSMINLGGWTATTRVVTPGLDGDNGSVGERWVGRTIEERRALATSRIARWKGGTRNIGPLRIAMASGPGNDLLFERIAQDLKAIGLDTRRVATGADADLRLVDVVARYAAPAWFLDQLACSGTNKLCNQTADQLVDKALIEPDPLKRADFYASAEAQLTITNSYIPFGVPVRWSLISASISGFAPNRWAIHPLMPMAILPK
ncbi:MAG: ABC transporter substrate-binding protein [Novosphingobium sp.]|uniref:ABC transporter substrate-binding protein n=1 Tax=Novosphingobium sp. TaxID=1874826 RepID=UPI0032BB13C9